MLAGRNETVTTVNKQDLKQSMTRHLCMTSKHFLIFTEKKDCNSKKSLKKLYFFLAISFKDGKLLRSANFLPKTFLEQ